MKKRLGEILVERGLIDVDQLNAGLAHQRQWGVRLGAALVAKGFIAEGMLTQVLSESLGIPLVDLSRVLVERKAIQLVPRRLAEQHDVLPIGVREQPTGRKLLYLGMADPLNATAIDEIGFTTESVVKPAIVQISSLHQAIRRYYGGEQVEVSPLVMTKPAVAPEKASGRDEPMVIITGFTEKVVPAWPTTPSPAAPSAQPSMIPPGSPSAIFQMSGAPPGPAGPPGASTPFPMFPGAMPAPPDYAGFPAFSMPPLPPEAYPPNRPAAVPRPADLEEVEALEKKFWALMRVLTRRGVVTKEEFLAELKIADEKG